MLQYFIMTRTGYYEADKATSNQCKIQGHIGYNYTIKLAVNGVKQSLDNDKFIIDHEAINQFIINSGLSGSCEEMHLLISERLPKFLRSKGVKLLGYCCKIVPNHNSGHEPAPKAFMEYMKIFNDKNTHLVPLLTL